MKQLFLSSLLAAALAASAAPVQSLDELSGPCTVTEFDIYADGGTLGGVLEDAHGNVLEFCLDGRLVPVEFTADGAPIPRPPTCFFLGAMHPEHDGARALEHHGAAEQRLLQVLKSWVDTEIPAEGSNDLRAAYNASPSVRAREDLVREGGLSRDQARALRVNRMVAQREAELGAVDSPR